MEISKPKENYAVQKRIAPSANIEAVLDELFSDGVADAEKLAEIGRLGAQLVLQRAIEEEVTAFLGRARYQRTPAARGSRNGVRPRRVQTGEGELEIQVPQLRDTAEQFVSRVIPEVGKVVRTRPLESLVIGAYVRGLSDRDVESRSRRPEWAACREAPQAESAVS
jgi:putative transposase